MGKLFIIFSIFSFSFVLLVIICMLIVSYTRFNCWAMHYFNQHTFGNSLACFYGTYKLIYSHLMCEDYVTRTKGEQFFLI